MLELKLPYGLKNGELVTIDEVENGLACECTCPGCNNKLVARKGSIKVHHFAHFNAPECSGGLETALHKICKEIISKSATFTTPPYYDYNGKEILKSTGIAIEDVQLEKRLGTMIPDIIILCKGKRLLVEIEVTNPVDHQKLQKIKQENLAAISIDARGHIQNMFQEGDFWLKSENFRKELIEGTGFKSWLHNPKYKAFEREKRYWENKSDVEGIEREMIKKDDEIPDGKIKEVKSFRTNANQLFYYVEDCQILKRFWKSGLKKGKSYASTHDCSSCQFCNTIEYGYHMKNGEATSSFPIKIYCLGHFDNTLDIDKYDVFGVGPKGYFTKAGKFKVTYDANEMRFFYQFHKAYNFYLGCKEAAIWDITKKHEELIELKRFKRSED